MPLAAEQPTGERASDSDGASSRPIKAASPGPAGTTATQAPARASLGDRLIALTQDLTVDAFVVKHERWVPLVIFAITFFTRFYRLDKPPGVVFDEHHFGRFTGQYLAGTYYFDIHPPLVSLLRLCGRVAVGRPSRSTMHTHTQHCTLSRAIASRNVLHTHTQGKLVFYWVARAVGYDYTVCHYEKIDDPYAPDCKFYWLRATAALFGSATAPLVYYIARGFGGSVWAGLLASLLFCFDGLNAGACVITAARPASPPLPVVAGCGHHN